MKEFIEGLTLMLVLFNPFLMSVYLIDFIRELSIGTFARVLLRASLISVTVFLIFAFFGDRLFQVVFHVRFESFLIFGGLVFLFIGLRFVFLGADAMKGIRGEAQHVSGSIAMPFMIGPGTVSASVLIGSRMNFPEASLAIGMGVLASVGMLVAVKFGYDYAKLRREDLIERYLDLAGRLSALFIGTFAIEMILQGLDSWKGR